MVILHAGRRNDKPLGLIVAKDIKNAEGSLRSGNRLLGKDHVLRAVDRHLSGHTEGKG
jgi:hypothetical protein